MRQFAPIADWLPNYNRSHLRGDVAAGLTVGVVLIPQGMAYAMLAGLPPIYGLYASLVPLVLYALFGSSGQLAVGPVAMVALLTASGLSTLAQPGSDEYIALAIVLAFLIGCIQFGMGVLRFGFLFNFLSHPVVTGFTSAAAIIIGLSQLKHLLGIEIPGAHSPYEMIRHAIRSAGETNLPTLSLGLAAIVLILALKRWKKTYPGALLAVALGVIAVWLFGLSEKGVQVIGAVPRGAPSLSTPLLEWEIMLTLFPIAMAIALVSFTESISVAKMMAHRHGDTKLDSNQELIGLGIANLGGAFFQSFPVAGGFSRTALNDQAGAKTALATLISAGVVGVSLLFLTPLFTYLPNVILAAVIWVAAIGLIDPREFLFLWRTKREDFFMCALTFIVTLSVGIKEGIAAGVALSLGMMIYHSTRPHVAALGKLPGTTIYRNVNRFPEAEQRDDLLIVRFDSMLYFANVDYFKETLLRFGGGKRTGLRLVVIDASSITAIDSSGVHALKEVIDDYQKRGITVYLAAVLGPVRDVLHRAGIIDHIGKGNFFMNVSEAVDCFDDPERRRADEAQTLQVNLGRTHTKE